MNLADTTERLIAKWDSWLSDTGNRADTALFQKLVQTRILNEEIADDLQCPKDKRILHVYATSQEISEIAYVSTTSPDTNKALIAYNGLCEDMKKATQQWLEEASGKKQLTELRPITNEAPLAMGVKV